MEFIMGFIRSRFNLIAARLFYNKQGRLSITKLCTVLGISAICFMYNSTFASLVTGCIVLFGCVWVLTPVVTSLFSGFGGNNDEEVESHILDDAYSSDSN
jgi:hypothetical protein